MQNDIVRQQPKQAEEPVAKPIDDIRPPAQPTVATNDTEITLAIPGSNHDENSKDAKLQSEEKPSGLDKNPAAPHQKSTKPVAVIAAAVIVCALLIGGTVYGTLAQKDEVATPSGKSSTQATNAKTNTTGTVAQELDVSINDAANFTDDSTDTTSELSDESLGL